MKWDRRIEFMLVGRGRLGMLLIIDKCQLAVGVVWLGKGGT